LPGNQINLPNRREIYSRSTGGGGDFAWQKFSRSASKDTPGEMKKTYEIAACERLRLLQGAFRSLQFTVTVSAAEPFRFPEIAVTVTVEVAVAVDVEDEPLELLFDPLHPDTIPSPTQAIARTSQ
jgi:hypothetical protein